MAKEYLTVNGKLVTVDGKLVRVPDTENTNDLVDEQASYATQFSRLVKEIEELIVNGVIDGSPKGVYENLSALQTAYPDGTSGVYLTSDNGHWYYYNNGWQDGGVYRSDGLELPKSASFDSLSADEIEVAERIFIDANGITTNKLSLADVGSTSLIDYMDMNVLYYDDDQSEAKGIFEFGNAESDTLINSKNKPYWYNGTDFKELATMDDIGSGGEVGTIQICFTKQTMLKNKTGTTITVDTPADVTPIKGQYILFSNGLAEITEVREKEVDAKVICYHYVKINDEIKTTPSIYAPTEPGTSGQILQSTGGEPEWIDMPSSGTAEMKGSPVYYGTCDTVNGTAVKIVACENFVLETGATINVKFSNYNSVVTPSLNVNTQLCRDPAVGVRNAEEA